jgi:hypothetical protein
MRRSRSLFLHKDKPHKVKRLNKQVVELDEEYSPDKRSENTETAGSLRQVVQYS